VKATAYPSSAPARLSAKSFSFCSAAARSASASSSTLTLTHSSPCVSV
jgi:hypothetical protein